MQKTDVFEFWNAQASKAEKAGSQDVLAKSVEVAAIAAHIRDGMRVCEFGCGNGETAIRIAGTADVQIDCYDFAPAMIASAQRAAESHALTDRLTFAVADIGDQPALHGPYDAVYTERMIINLPTWDAQRRAILHLAGALKPGGRLLLCENSNDGLAKLNALRDRVGLDAIVPPWHNCYLNDADVAAVAGRDLQLVAVEPFSSTYYFLSRVVNAWLAKWEGRQPAYDAPVNQLALSLPPFGDCAQGKLWIFERPSSGAAMAAS